MKKLPDLNQITPAALLNMPTAAQLKLLDELEYRAYLVRTLAGIHHEHGGHFMRRCVDTLRLLRDAGAGDAQALQAVLQDGAALASLGLGDDDAELVEYLHGVAGDESDLLVVYAGADPIRAQLFDNQESALLWCERANRRQDKTKGVYVTLGIDEYMASNF